MRDAIFVSVVAGAFFVVMASAFAALLVRSDKLPRVVSAFAQPLSLNGPWRFIGLGFSLVVACASQTLVGLTFLDATAQGPVVAMVYFIELLLAGFWVVFLVRRYRA